MFKARKLWQDTLSGYYTVQSYNQIVCWSGDYDNGDKHAYMVILGLCLSVVPISFVALSVWVVAQLPARVRKGDTKFLHTFSFLHFNPRAYWHVLVLLLRNLAATWIPLVANEALQLFLMVVALAPPFVICVAYHPWRNYIGNVIDLATNTGLALIFLAALLSDSANEIFIAEVLIAVFCAMCAIFLIAVLWCLCTVFLRSGKTCQFFLCHHKHAGGGFAGFSNYV